MSPLVPLVSVIVPMRNAESFVGATLSSLLAEREVALEVVVVNDGSTDGSARVVSKMAAGDSRVRMIAGPCRGISACFNTGLEAARGQYVARCDADDLYPAGRLARQARWLSERPSFGAVAGGFATINSRGRLVTERLVSDGQSDVTDELLAGNGRTHLCAYLMRTDLLHQIGGCRTWFVMSEDADLQYRLAERTRVGYEATVAYLYRLHDASITHSRSESERLFFEAAAKRFLGQRRSGGRDDLERGCPPAIPTGADATAAGSTATAATDSARHIQKMLLGEAWQAHRRGHRMQAVWNGLRACMAAPTSPTAWRSLGALTMKRPGRPTPRTA